MSFTFHEISTSICVYYVNFFNRIFNNPFIITFLHSYKYYHIFLKNKILPLNSFSHSILKLQNFFNLNKAQNNKNEEKIAEFAYILFQIRSAISAMKILNSIKFKQSTIE